MSRIAIALALTGILAACSGQRAAPSVLQRYQSLSPALSTVTSLTLTAARDMAILGAQLKNANAVRVRGQAVLLQSDGRELSSHSGSVAASVRSITVHEKDHLRLQYFKTVLNALADQWAEGKSLMAIARLVWWDPDAIQGHDAARLAVLSSQARLEAWNSVRATSEAQAWRARHRGSFRFIPVTASSRFAAIP